MEKKTIKLFIVGGHITPALAVIEELIKRDDIKIYFIGRKHPLEGDSTLSFEYQMIERLNLPFLELTTGRLQRKLTPYTLLSIFKIPLGVIASFIYLLKYKPDIILSFGGYLALPVCISGSILRIPIIIHEQTVKAGLTNKLTSCLAQKILVSYPSSYNFFPKEKTVLTGNPLRKSLFSINQPKWAKDSTKPLIYITGGSLGAHKINELIKDILDKLLLDFYIIHQTGDAKEYNDFEKLAFLKTNLPLGLKDNYQIRKFINDDEIGWILNKASFLISRGGANIVSEVLTLGKPAIFIPLPYVEEQKENALMAKNSSPKSLYEILNQNDLTPHKLLEVIKNFSKGLKLSQERPVISTKLNSGKDIADIVYETARSYSKHKHL